MGGQLLELQEPPFSLNVLLSYKDSSATILSQDLPSCKPGSVLHHVDGMLASLNLQVPF